MKTNREIFMNELNNSNMDNFIDLINSCGKCNRCSNNYWDGNVNSCHKNINNSSCEDGQREYFESYPEENLQNKYNKKYWHCKGYSNAQSLNNLTEILYSCGVIEWKGVDNCKYCHNKGKECYSVSSKCFWLFQYLLNLHSDYVKDKIKKLNDFDKLIYKENMTFEKWLTDIVIPSISDKLIRDKAEHFLDLVFSDR